MNIESAYQDALDYLYTFVDYSLTRSFRYTPDKFDLDRMQIFAEHLGNPHHAYPILHVAGTKGKGSVSALCASALQAAGYRVGLYTSPHLEDFTERIQVDKVPIPAEDLVELVNEIKPYLDSGTKLTTFEITTALGFLYFARRGATAVVAEVGLGGRLDATNIVHPKVAVITSLSYDHEEFLGETLALIAAEKAGIIKPNVPVVLSPQKSEARIVVERIAEERGSPLVQVGRDYLFAADHHTLDDQSLLVWPASEQPLVDAYIESGGTQEWEPTRLTIPMLGYHQVENAATAYTCLKIASKHGLAINELAIRQGFSNVHWPARFEVLQKHPAVVVDSAHNRDSALKLRLALDDYFPGHPVILIFGASEDKDVDGMFAELMPRVSQVVVTRSIHPRSMDPEQIAPLAHRHGKAVKIAPDVESALKTALNLTRNEAMVLVTGSIFVAAGARQVWHNLGNGSRAN